MKKLIIVLMMVAMASFLFVGCLSGTTTPATTTTTTTTTTTPTTVAPVITAVAGIGLTASAQQYINAAQAAVVIVTGTAPTYSEVKVYVDGITAGTGDTTVNGTFSVVIAEADLGADGTKTLYATATETGLAESAHSVEYDFILDQVAPKIEVVKATAFAAATGGTTTTDAVANLITQAASTDIAVTTADVESGTWHLLGLGATTVQVTNPDNVVTYLTNLLGGESYPGTLIPGVTITLVGTPVTALYVDIVCVVEVALIIDRATLEFDEDVTTTSVLAATYAFADVDDAGVTLPGVFVFTDSNDTIYWNGFGGGGMALYETVGFTVSDVDDLAGNTIAALSSASCTVGVANATSLAP